MKDQDRPDILVVGPYTPEATALLGAAYEIHRLPEGRDAKAFLAGRAGRIRAIATTSARGAGADLIAALPNLEIICCHGVGTDAIDLPAAAARGIPVTNTPDVLTGDVADLAVGLALAVVRRIPAADAYVRSGAWANGPLGLVRRFFGRRVGIAGFGRIGTMVAKRLSGFDVEIGYFATAAHPGVAHPYFGSVESLAKWSDVMIVTLAGGQSTSKMIDASALAALGPEGYLVNVSRGMVVDEAALLKALESRSIAGAGLDVFWNEPNVNPRFWVLDNVVLQPHHASATVETRTAMAELVRANLDAHFAGRPLLTRVP